MNIRVRKRIYYCLVASLLIHIGFMIWSYFVRMVPAVTSVEKTQKTIHVKIAKEESHGQQAISDDTHVSQQPTRPENALVDTKIFEPPVDTKESIKEILDASVQKKENPAIPNKTEDLPVLEKPQLDDVLITKKVRRATRKNLVDVGDLTHTEFASGSPVIISGEEISNDFLDKSNLATNISPDKPAASANGPNEYQIMQKGIAGLDRKLKVQDSGTSLAYELKTYKDPQSHEQYFKLLVKVRNATVNFPVIPKEIIFLLDASASIEPARLTQFEEGLKYSLNNLNAHDKFNIIVFKDKTIPLSPSALTNTPENIKEAMEFIDALKSGSTTDVYNALKISFDVKENFTPSYRLLLTDGYPTKGIVDARQVINEVSRINDGKVSIFTFGGGVSVSRYMLDFVAYKNRGWSHYTDREYLIAKELNKLYDRIKDPLLLNIRFRTSGLNDKEIFPQTMPDFFKGSEFVIYGKYTNEDKFFLQVLGEVLGETKEFTVNEALSNAQAGDKDIAHQWAFHKVYYLIGQLKYKEDNDALISQINELCEAFNIITPYSIESRRKPVIIKKQEQEIKKPEPNAPAVVPTTNFNNQNIKK